MLNFQRCALLAFLAALIPFFCLNKPTVATAAPPAITNITMVSAGPQLSIVATVGETNLIETISDLTQTNWLVLQTLVVTQGSYTFVDSSTIPDGKRFYRVASRAVQPPGTPPGMAVIPAGSFVMGDTFSEGASYELPLHTVYVSTFYMDKYEVTKALWDQVRTWSVTNGYSYDYPGDGKAPNHPVQNLDWYDMVKWCNARSQMEGRAPCYYTDAALTQLYTNGHAAPFVNWNGGYRLPTEAEWEKAARGGAAGHRFAWTDTDTISHSQANYYSDASYPYDVSPTRGFNPAFVDGNPPYTSPVGSFAPNGYGLYDTAGNIWEWCWDWAGDYTTDPQTDPRGPDTGNTRVGRGGNWNYYAEHCRNSYRYGNSPDYIADNIGFRCAMTAGH